MKSYLGHLSFTRRAHRYSTFRPFLASTSGHTDRSKVVTEDKFTSYEILRELKQRRRRRQREGQKSNKFRLIKQQLCSCITALFFFFAVAARLQRENA